MISIESIWDLKVRKTNPIWIEWTERSAIEAIGEQEDDLWQNLFNRSLWGSKRLQFGKFINTCEIGYGYNLCLQRSIPD